jgi:hypothetical protein
VHFSCTSAPKRLAPPRPSGSGAGPSTHTSRRPLNAQTRSCARPQRPARGHLAVANRRRLLIGAAIDRGQPPTSTRPRCPVRRANSRSGSHADLGCAPIRFRPVSRLGDADKSRPSALARPTGWPNRVRRRAALRPSSCRHGSPCHAALCSMSDSAERRCGKGAAASPTGVSWGTAHFGPPTLLGWPAPGELGPPRAGSVTRTAGRPKGLAAAGVFGGSE